MRKYLAIAATLAALALSACGKDAIEASVTNNPEIDVQRLFDHEGCTVYRFFDSRPHYYVKCTKTGEVVETYHETCGPGCVIYSAVIETYTKSCGKKCTTTEDRSIPTSYEAANG